LENIDEKDSKFENKNLETSPPKTAPYSQRFRDENQTSICSSNTARAKLRNKFWILRRQRMKNLQNQR